MKQVKQVFELNYSKSIYYEKVVKQNETTYRSVTLSLILYFYVDNQMVMKYRFFAT